MLLTKARPKNVHGNGGAPPIRRDYYCTPFTPQLLPDDRRLVGGFLDDLRGGFARALAGLGPDADER